MYRDKVLTCKDCGNEFSFTASEQQFFADKGFTNEPSRCPECRAARKNRNSGNSRRNFGPNAQREMFNVTCSACGVATQVPFRPDGSKPVYCRDCFKSAKRY